MTTGREVVGMSDVDFLIFDTKFPTDTKSIALKSGQGIVRRGTVIAFDATFEDGGEAWSGVNGQIANCVICDDIDTGEDEGSTVIGQAYRSGHFARQALVLSTGVDELTNLAEKQLNDAGIYLSNVVL